MSNMGWRYISEAWIGEEVRNASSFQHSTRFWHQRFEGLGASSIILLEKVSSVNCIEMIYLSIGILLLSEGRVPSMNKRDRKKCERCSAKETFPKMINTLCETKSSEQFIIGFWGGRRAGHHSAKFGFQSCSSLEVYDTRSPLGWNTLQFGTWSEKIAISDRCMTVTLWAHANTLASWWKDISLSYLQTGGNFKWSERHISFHCSIFK